MVIFDGLDEIFDAEDREHITNQIVGFTSDYPKARVFVTSRLIGYRRKILSDAGFKHYTLQDLDESQIRTFIDRWYSLALADRAEEAESRRERLLRSFKEYISIRQLAGNPMLLTIMAIIGKHQELPRERWKLYEHASSVLIQHWDVNKHLKDQRVEADFIGEDDKKELLRRLAFHMQRGTGGLAGNYIHHEQLQSVFENYLTDRYAQTADRSKLVAETMIRQFRERNFILSLYGANIYGFVHRAFLEHFCAAAFVHKFEKSRELSLEQLKRDIFIAHKEDQSWHEVLRLVCGMIDDRFAGEIIDCLTTELDDRDLRYFWGPSDYENNLLLALQCFSEVRNLITIVLPATRLLWAVYLYFRHVLTYRSILIRYFGADSTTETQMLALVKSLGPNWPNRAIVAGWLKNLTLDRFGDYDYEIFPQFIGYVGVDSVETSNILAGFAQDDDERFRAVVPFALACGWHDVLETRSKVSDMACNDGHFAVRKAAVSALAQHYREDAETLPIIRDRATNDAHEDVREAAVSALAQHYREDTETLPIIRDRATNDAHEDVRKAAVSALAQHYREDTETLPIIRDRATNDAHEDVRKTAVSALAQHYREDAETLPIIRDRATNDAHEDVRKAAVSALAQHYREDAETLPIIRDRATNDAHEDVRKAAVSALAQHYREDAETLPIIRDRATNDAHKDVREAAVSALAQHYREDAETLPIIRDRALHDESPTAHDFRPFINKGVRELAIRVLARYWTSDPITAEVLDRCMRSDQSKWIREFSSGLSLRLRRD